MVPTACQFLEQNLHLKGRPGSGVLSNRRAAAYSRVPVIRVFGTVLPQVSLFFVQLTVANRFFRGYVFLVRWVAEK